MQYLTQIGIPVRPTNFLPLLSSTGCSDGKPYSNKGQDKRRGRLYALQFLASLGRQNLPFPSLQVAQNKLRYLKAHGKSKRIEIVIMKWNEIVKLIRGTAQDLLKDRDTSEIVA